MWLTKNTHYSLLNEFGVRIELFYLYFKQQILPRGDSQPHQHHASKISKGKFQYSGKYCKIDESNSYLEKTKMKR